MDHQVDKIVMTATSTSINVGPFAPSSPGTVVKIISTVIYSTYLILVLQKKILYLTLQRVLQN